MGLMVSSFDLGRGRRFVPAGRERGTPGARRAEGYAIGAPRAPGAGAAPTAGAGIDARREPIRPR